MTIETKRLLLCPLSARQMRLWLSDLPALEREWDCHYEGEPVEGTFREIVQQQWKITSMDERNYLFHSFWLLLRKADRTVVGAADFKAPPNARGEVEIGYGLGGAHERRGYMTEAVDALCDWALQREDVESVCRNGTQETALHKMSCGVAGLCWSTKAPPSGGGGKNKIRAAGAQMGRTLRILLFCSVEGGEKQKGLSEKIDGKRAHHPMAGRCALFCPLAGCNDLKGPVQ